MKDTLIEKYLFNKLNEEETTLFLELKANDAEFREELEYQENLKQVIKIEDDLQFNKPFIFLLLTTPEYHKDGSASWCEVAASETPEKIYEKNKIPHFFVFEMTIL